MEIGYVRANSLVSLRSILRRGRTIGKATFWTVFVPTPQIARETQTAGVRRSGADATPSMKKLAA
jgi:hypothetical protein